MGPVWLSARHAPSAYFDQVRQSRWFQIDISAIRFPKLETSMLARSEWVILMLLFTLWLKPHGAYSTQPRMFFIFTSWQKKSLTRNCVGRAWPSPHQSLLVWIFQSSLSSPAIIRIALDIDYVVTLNAHATSLVREYLLRGSWFRVRDWSVGRCLVTHSKSWCFAEPYGHTPHTADDRTGLW